MENERIAGGLRCSEVLEMLSDYVDGELLASQVAQIDEHIANCDNCRRFGVSFGKMLTQMRQSPTRIGVPPEVASRLDGRLPE